MASNEEERLKSLELEVEDVCRARQAVERLSGSKLREEIEAYVADAKDTQSICKVGVHAGTTLLKSYGESFWQRCYVEIYPRGDCGENDGDTRKHRFQGREYSGHLFELFDKPWFREHKELNASFYKFFVRRDQMDAVNIELRTNQKLKNDAATIRHLHSTDLKALAATASDNAMLKSILCDESVIASVRTSLYHVQRIMSKVIGTDSERDPFRKSSKVYVSSMVMLLCFGP